VAGGHGLLRKPFLVCIASPHDFCIPGPAFFTQNAIAPQKKPSFASTPISETVIRDVATQITIREGSNGNC